MEIFDKKPDVQTLAAKGDMKGLVKALKDKDWEVRDKATKALANIGGPAMPTLIEALKDKDSFLRGQAIEVLSKIGPELKSAMPALIEARKREDLRVATAYAL